MNLDHSIWGNPLRMWLIALATTFVLLVILLFVRRTVVRWFDRRVQGEGFRISRIVASLVQSVSTVFLFAICVSIGSHVITLDASVHHIIAVFVKLALFFQIGLLAQAAIDILLNQARGTQRDRVSDSAIMGFSLLGKVTLWVVLILVSLENLGVNMTTLIASLGVGGIAVGLAMQRVVGDLISSLAIVFDRPFTHGDFIGVDTVSGTVEKIGLKTTKIRSLSGEVMVVPNADLIQSRIHNYRTLQERRIVFTIGVTYDTPSEKLEAIPGMVRSIIEQQQPAARFDRTHFKTFGPYSLDYEIVFYMTSPDYALYMDTQQAINFALVRRFEAEGIEFAFPTQTLYMQPAQISVNHADAQLPRG